MIALLAMYGLISFQNDKTKTRRYLKFKNKKSNSNIYPCCYTQIISLLRCCIDAFMHWNVLNLETEIMLTITDK